MQEKEKLGKIVLTWWLWFVWSHTAVVFGQAGYELVIIDNLSNSHLDVLAKIEELSGVKPSFYDADLRNLDELKKIFEEHHDVDGVIHLAAKKYIWESCQEPFLYYENNISWSINLCKAMIATKVKRNIVFSSTWAIYDAKNNLPPYAETDRLDPSNPYASSKLIMERIFKDMSMQKQFNNIILRYFNPIGAHHSGILWENPKWIPSNLVPFVYKVIQWEIDELKIFGNDYDTKDGTGVRDYIHIMDVAEAHLLAFQYLNEFNKYQWEKKSFDQWLYDIFNIWTGEWVSVKEIIALVERVTEKKVPFKTTKRRPWDVDTSIANPQKAKQVLGRQAKRSVYQALEDGRRYIYKNSY